MNEHLINEAEIYNIVLTGYLHRFMYKYDFKQLDMDITTNKKVINAKMIGIGADEFHMVRGSTYVGIQSLKVGNRVALNFSQEISYAEFDREVIGWLTWSKVVKQSCKLKRKKL